MACGRKGEWAEPEAPRTGLQERSAWPAREGKPSGSARGPTLKFPPHSGTLCQAFPTPPREPRESPLNLWEQ